jgi:hypothetical protein
MCHMFLCVSMSFIHLISDFHSDQPSPVLTTQLLFKVVTVVPTASQLLGLFSDSEDGGDIFLLKT